MRARATAAAVFAAALVMGGFGLSTSSAQENDKVTICHAAGQDDTTQFVEITAAYEAIYGQAGHFYEDGTPRAGHEQDYEGPCEVPTTTTLPPTTSSTSTSTTSTSTTSTSTTSTSTTLPTTTSTIVGPSLFAFGAAGTECQAEVPVIVISFANTFPELAGEVGVLQVFALADDSFVGEVEVVYAPGETVTFLYPGAVTDADGNIIDLPGWTLQANGLWVIDESDAYLREGLLLEYTLGEEVATAEVTYPPESSTCADPPPPGPTTTTTTVPGETTTTFTPIAPIPPPSTPSLPRTGGDIALPVAGALALIGTGLMLMDVRGRRAPV